jgi:hypothetical protein
MRERFVSNRSTDLERSTLIGLETTAEVAAATARLGRRSPDALAAFIVSLAHMSGLVREHVIDFIAADNPSQLGAHLRQHIQWLRQDGERRWRGAKGAGVAIRLESLLDSIENYVLPVDAAGALALLALLIESDGAAMEQCADAHYEVGRAIERACTLVGIAAASLPPESTRESLQRLLARDDYGCRQTLVAVMEGLLGNECA